jgi:hypothetical protein
MQERLAVFVLNSECFLDSGAVQQQFSKEKQVIFKRNKSFLSTAFKKTKI